MDYRYLMGIEGYIYLNQLFEPEENALCVRIDRCMVNDKKGLADLGDQQIETFAIEADTHQPILQLYFDTYVSYSVINESFTVIDDYEQFKGKIFRIYSKSRYLDFVKRGTIAEELVPDEQFTHYQIPCLNHIIDIVSYDEPTITELERD
ncbi:hypothetical protein NIE88_06285 [Sporolactobacillus shoreicorticis]|uniref:Uncharacterized protein n=1 Tax=Sporolactobacillus shoreicorticis TaxID=1923877 RepID=A0ABW5S1Y2_9BACL|nr:hypothetical protein [Sporolactobacillus shoreicorticis]MCO7125374.1 hypothetical protein [Sporolactobacillus shoreicorticis]